MSVNRRDFLKRAGAGAALIAGGTNLLQGSAFAREPKMFEEKSDISFVGSSASGNRKQMIKDVLEPWRAKVSAGISGKTVLIKPNLVYNPELACTHVDAVSGVIEFIRSISTTVPIIIGECSVFEDVTPLYKSYGYNSLPTQYTGVTLANLNDTAKKVDCHIWNTDLTTTTPIPISSAFQNQDYYMISICRAKTHNCMVMTGVNKNILMAAPLSAKKQQMHGKIGWYSGKNPDELRCLAYNLYQLANIIYPKYAPKMNIIDAWEGMEGDGPVSGTSIMQYCAVAGEDPLAVDRVCAKLMGFSDSPTDPMNKNTPSYTDMRALVWISNAGFGNYDLNKINFILGSIDTLTPYIKNYELSPNYTGDPSYETEWNAPQPLRVLGSTSVKNSKALNPKPFLVPQISIPATGKNVLIEFTLPVNYLVEIGIYDLKGVLIRKLGNDFLTAGKYSIAWDKCDNTGSPVSAGRYAIKLKFGSQIVCDQVSIGR